MDKIPTQEKKNLRKLAYLKQFPEILETDGGHPASQARDKFEDGEQLVVKHSAGKPILPNLVNLSTIACPKLSEETTFPPNLAQAPWSSNSVDFSNSKHFQPAIKCSKLPVKTLKQCVKYVHKRH